MPSRRDFLKTAAVGAAAACVTGRGVGARAAAAQDPGARRQVTIGNRRVRVIDVHAHCVISVEEIVKGTPLAGMGGGAGNNILGPARLRLMDEQGVDVQALSINGYWWYAADRGLAPQIVRAQNEGLATWVAAHPDRFVGMASVALQHPDLAAEQLEDGVKRLGLRGVSIGGHVNGEDLSLPKYDPFWAKAAELGALVFMHPGGAENIVKPGALGGRGDLGNIIGNPLETTYFLSRLIFDGTLDKFPGLRVCGAHAGGYLPSYLGRTEAACAVRANAKCANRKKPSEYLRSQISIDTMVFSDEGLRHLVAEVGIGQVVYGTDVPFNWPVTVDLVLNASFLSEADKEAILGLNLMKLLHLNV
ncbi:MAG TPA: amidohydrolase family protein [Vicinamibacterales bacterium]|nr:amidohydrolase family protein [Vicinamibacterales bacterium]